MVRARLRLLGAHGGRLAMGGAYAEYCWVMNEMSGLVSRGGVASHGWKRDWLSRNVEPQPRKGI